MLKIYYKSLRDTELQPLDDFKVGCWIYVEDPDEAELEVLAKDYSLDIGHLNDAVDPFEVPRLEIEKEAVYIYRRVPFEQEERLITVPVLIAIGEDFVITVSRQPLPFLQKFIKNRIDFNTTQKTKLVLQILNEISITYNNYLATIGRRVRGISVSPNRIDNKTILQFVTFEEALNDFLAGLVPAAAILERLLSGKVLSLHEKDKDLVEDLTLSTGQLISQARSSLRTIVNIREAYSTIMTNDLNRVIKILTALTIILNVSMITTGLFGMNVALPFADSPSAFWGIIFFSGIISLILLFVFTKNRWL